MRWATGPRRGAELWRRRATRRPLQSSSNVRNPTPRSKDRVLASSHTNGSYLTLSSEPPGSKVPPPLDIAQAYPLARAALVGVEASATWQTQRNMIKASSLRPPSRAPRGGIGGNRGE